MNHPLLLKASLMVTLASSVLIAAGAGPVVPGAGPVGPSDQPADVAARVQEQPMTAEHRLLTKSAKGSLVEVELGKLAKDKAKDPQVIDFGERMVKDHTQILSDVRALGAKLNLTLPSDEDGKEKAERMKADLEKLEGAKFDRAYLKHMVEDHEKDISETKQLLDEVKDADVKLLGDKLLTTYNEHLELAKKVSKSLKNQ